MHILLGQWIAVFGMLQPIAIFSHYIDSAELTPLPIQALFLFAHILAYMLINLIQFEG